jgi:hypothetical protein
MSSQINQTPQNVIELIQSISVQILGSSKHAKFQQMYKNDRIAFVYDALPAFRKTLAPYQEEILGYFDDGQDRVAVRGPHGLGKTFIAAILTHHGVLTADVDAKIPTTASAWRQLEYYLWPEIRKIAKALDWVTIGREPYQKNEMLQLSLKLGGIVEAFAVASDDHTTIEGAHATRIFYIFDEAKTIPRPTWNAAEGAFSTGGLGRITKAVEFDDIVDQPGLYIREGSSNLTEIINPLDTQNKGNGKGLEGEIGVIDGPITSTTHAEQLPNEIDAPGATPALQGSNTIVQGSMDTMEHVDNIEVTIDNLEVMEAKALCISTPGEPSGQFYDIHSKKVGYEDWLVRHVKVEEAIAAGRISAKWVRQRAKQWGVDSSIFQNRVLGEFADMTEEGVIPLSWIRLAHKRWSNWYAKGGGSIIRGGKQTIGVDVARSGEAKTVLALRNALIISGIHVYSKLPLTSIAGHIQALSKGRYIHIETDGGLGAGVYDILKEDGVPLLRPITVNGTTHMRDKSNELGFENVRAAMWWNMRELLDPINGEEVMLPPIDLLTSDLSTPRWEMKRNAIVKLESKVNIELRIGRSTDYGDAVCLAFWKTSSGGGIVF